MESLNWTKEYCRVSFYPANKKYSTTDYWGSIENGGKTICAKFWTPDCGFNPVYKIFTDIDEAKTEIEQWYKSKVLKNN